MHKCAAQKYLEQIQYIKISISAKKAQIEELRVMSDGLKSSLGGDAGGGGSAGNATYTNAINKIIDIQFAIASEHYKLAAAIEDIHKRIANMNKQDSQLALVLELRYINCLSWRKVRVIMDYEERNIYKLHSLALQMFSNYI